MKSNTKIIFIMAAICFCFVLSIILIVDYLEARSYEQLKLLLGEVKVGLPLSEVTKKLGKPARVLTKVKDVEEWGTIKDRKTIEGCDLYMFPYLGMPHKYILVYVRKDSNEVHIVKEAPM